MLAVNVHTVNAFVEDDGTGGNPAGVVLSGGNLTSAQKQKIAEIVGLSETAFVSASNYADVRLEFFTPTRQVPHCGHATVAAFTLLASRGLVPKPESSKETIEGIRRILLLGQEVALEQQPPVTNRVEDPGEILRALGLAEEELVEKTEPAIVSTGMPFLLLPVKRAETLRRMKPEKEALLELSRRYHVLGFYFFTCETKRSGRQAAARMFAPAAGIDEESATGMAAGPLACYLREYLGFRSDTFVIEQGGWMKPPAPSKLIVRLTIEEGRIAGLMVSGKGKYYGEKTITF